MSDSVNPQDDGAQHLSLLSYNIQVGIGSTRASHYLTKSWKHVLPARRRLEHMSRIASFLHAYDIVALQEVDAGSHRTGFVDMTEYMALKAQFPFWHHQLNRNLGRLAQHGNGLLSRYRPSEIEEYKLPGNIPGRGGLLARFSEGEEPLAVMLIHLALGRKARLNQLDFVAEILSDYKHAVLMGDMNCEPRSAEMRLLFNKTGLREPEEELHTFPSWRPQHNIDHILVTPSLEIVDCHVLQRAHSDHLPIGMELRLPEGVVLERWEGMHEAGGGDTAEESKGWSR